MRILLDECMPKLLKMDIIGHEVLTINEMGWAGTKNGKLLDIAEKASFDLLLTADQNIEHQQNLRGRSLALVIMVAPNKLPRLRPLVPALLKVLDSVRPGDVVHIGP